MKMRTKGRGSIQAFPTGAPDHLTGEVDFVVSELGEIRLKPKLGLWHVVAVDGRELLVPMAAAVVVWEQRQEQTRAPAEKKDLSSVKDLALAGSVFPQLRPPVFICPECKSSYTDPADMAVCLRRDRAGVGPVFRGGDCRDCGYPAELHHEVRLLQVPPPAAEVEAYVALQNEVERTGGAGAAGSQDAQKALAAAREPEMVWEATIPQKRDHACLLALSEADGVSPRVVSVPHRPRKA